MTASSSGASLTLTSKATGASTNYGLSGSSSTGQGGYFGSPSFSASPTSSTLLGGHDATYNTLFDTGTVSVTVNGYAKSATYNQSSTLSGMATALASAFQNDGTAPVNASAAGPTITVTARATGASTNYTLASSSTSQGSYFSHASYSGSASGSALTGGQDQGANINDAGSVSITVNGFAKSTTYNQSSTASSIASALSSAFNGDVNSPVSASVSGAQVTLTAKTGGAATNYSLSASSATTQSGFTGTSFPASPSGGALTGGGDSYQTPTTPYSVNLAYFPNGDVYTANDSVNGNWTHGYDDFNRLISSSKPGASYTYKYDRYGNRWQQNGPFSFVTTFSGGNNRMDGYSYDAAGNLLNDNAGHSFTYDAENRVIQVGTNVSYVYDGDGRRIRKTVSGTSVDFFYDLADHEIAEMNSSGGWNRGEVFAGDRHIATYNWGTTFFNHLDWLGTKRSRTAQSGAVSETCLSLPFGDGQSCSGNETTPNHFTGKERDTESGLGYFGARFFNSNQGRWLSADWNPEPEAIPYSDLNNPQSLNLYGYVRNNPLSKADADGHDVWDFLVGMGNSIGSDAVLGAGRNDYGNDDYKMGQAVGDFASTIIGAGESFLGGAVQGGGVVACSSGVGCLVGGPAVVGGAVMEVHGAAMATSGFVHLAKAASSGLKPGSTGGPGAGKKTTPEQRKQTLQENNGKCVVPGCNQPAEHADHAIPRSREGDTTKENLQGMCAHHNCPKGS